jgi:hypothetical protein
MEETSLSRVATVNPNEIQIRVRVKGPTDVEDCGTAESMQEQQHPTFPKLSSSANATGGQIGRIEYRRVRCPPHRYTPLREHWEQILTPLVEHLKLQVRVSCFLAVVEPSTLKEKRA